MISKWYINDIYINTTFVVSIANQNYYVILIQKDEYIRYLCLTIILTYMLTYMLWEDIKMIYNDIDMTYKWDQMIYVIFIYTYFISITCLCSNYEC